MPSRPAPLDLDLISSNNVEPAAVSSDADPKQTDTHHLTHDDRPYTPTKNEATPQDVPLTDDDDDDHDDQKDDTTSDRPVSWRELPKKDQLFVLTLARLAEPIVQAGLSSYMYFMIHSFDPSMSDAEVSSRAGFLNGSFNLAQCLTAVWWGRAADQAWMGRKNAILCGLAGALISSVGFGFSKSFATAVFFRALGGALNGNVGVMRTMISEIITERKYQPKSFLIMPLTFNVGMLVGPLLGGWLQSPVDTFPNVFGPGSALGGADGVVWMRTFPYALPNLVNAMFLFLAMSLVFFGLRETHIDKRDTPDYGIMARDAFLRLFRGGDRRNSSAYTYSRLDEYSGPSDLEMTPTSARHSSALPRKKQAKLPFFRMFTRNVILTLICHAMFALHLGAFNNLWFIFLSTPREAAGVKEHARRLPFHFSGGLGLDPPTIGFAIGILGAIGLVMQFGIYSSVTHRFGVLQTYRMALRLFPAVYALAPYLAVVATTSPPPHAADGPWMWIAICALLFVQVSARTFSLPLTQVLINNCTPHPSVLSSIHGVGQSMSAAGQTLGPTLLAVLYGEGLRKGVVGLAWWVLAGEAVLGAVMSQLIYEGEGYEIKLEGDEDYE